MKKILFLFIFVAHSSFASTLIKSSNIKFISQNGPVNFSLLSASLSIFCQYEALGESMPIPCGDRLYTFKASSDGVITIPRIEKFYDTFLPFKAHYDMSLTISSNSFSLMLITAEDDEIESLNFNNKPIYIEELTPTILDLRVNGTNFLDTDLPKNPLGEVSISLSETNPKKMRGFNYFTGTHLWAASNSINKKLLLAKEIKTIPTHFISFNPPEESKVQFVFSYVGAQRISKNIFVDIEKDVLLKLGAIELMR